MGRWGRGRGALKTFQVMWLDGGQTEIPLELKTATSAGIGEEGLMNVGPY